MLYKAKKKNKQKHKKKISRRRNKREGFKGSSLLAVYNAIRVVDLLNTGIALRRSDRWLLLTLDDLLWKTIRKRG